LIAILDTNNDGWISQSEFTAAVTGVGGAAGQASTLFSLLDTNGDGSISESELVNAMSNNRLSITA
jgi:Ca2+-binding EF-hand superfamily protein